MFLVNFPKKTSTLQTSHFLANLLLELTAKINILQQFFSWNAWLQRENNVNIFQGSISTEFAG